MKKQLFILGMASAAALTGCHGLKKVGFEDFCGKVKELKEVSPKTVKISGKVDGDKVNFTYEIPQSIGGAVDSIIDVATGKYSEAEMKAAEYISPIGGYTLLEDSSLTYFTGMGFKVKSDKKTVEWNGKGLTASYKDEKASLNFSWKLN